MEKFSEVFESTQDMFDEAMRTSGLDVLITAKVLRVPKQKEVIVPKKATPIISFLNNIDIFFYVQEEVFDRLEEISKRYLVEEAVNRIAYNFERSTIAINKGDVETQLLLLRKYGLDIYEALKVNIDQVETKLKEEKE